MLVAVVLLQPGKTDAGALFTSNISSNAFGPRGTATVLSKITIIAAAVFMLSALLISMPAFNGSVSVLNTVPEAPAEAPSTTATVIPVDTNSNAAPASEANTNSTAPATNANPAAANSSNSAQPANK